MNSDANASPKAAPARGAFHSLYSHGLARVAVCAPRVAIADPVANAAASIALARRADAEGAALTVFPELGLSAYTNDELFFQAPLLNAARSAIAAVAAATATLSTMIFLGAPLEVRGRLYNTCVVIQGGRVLGVVPKSYLPNYREFYEGRYFASGVAVSGETIELNGADVPFGTDLLFAAADLKDFVVGVEICEDMWVPVPPATFAAMAGATVIVNLSASNVTVGKSEFRKALCRAQAARTISAYVYSAAGPGESTTDLAWDGQGAVFDDGGLIAEAPRFDDGNHVLLADVDLERLRQERIRVKTWGDCAEHFRARTGAFRTVSFTLSPPLDRDLGLKREIERFPFVPADPEQLDADCYEAYNIQIHGLLTRLHATGIKKVVLGISGGLDSTQALIVCARTMDRLGLPRSNILAYTMPGFGTSTGTKDNAWSLMTAFGVTAGEIDIRDVATKTLKDIGHPAGEGVAQYDVTYENVQAGARTAYLFRLANLNDAIVIGTGDLSELALGWSTYGVGDHMSHYGVNGGVPKTMIQHLIRWVIGRDVFGEETSLVLQSVLDTEISPELLPVVDGVSQQRTEDKVGPYELQDFNLYYTVRHGFAPSKIAFLAWSVWRDTALGDWPPGLAADRRRSYDLPAIKKWLGIFVYRFFATSQFKRSALPNGPKVLAGASLSPRGDWRAPSDGNAKLWRAELEANVPGPTAP